jgi:hypothetical protein
MGWFFSESPEANLLGIPSRIASDRNLLAEMGKKGQFYIKFEIDYKQKSVAI